MPKEISPSRIILHAIEAAIKLLENLEIDYALMGGIALSVWGRERVTKDIDIVISVEEEKLKNLLNSLKSSPFKIRSSLKRLGDSLLFFATYEDKDTGFPIDIDLFIAQTDFQKEALRRSKEIEVLGRKLKVVTVDDLIIYKLLANRPIDLMDAQVLLEENKKDIDKDYLRRWAKRLGILGRFKKLCQNKCLT